MKVLIQLRLLISVIACGTRKWRFSINDWLDRFCVLFVLILFVTFIL